MRKSELQQLASFSFSVRLQFVNLKMFFVFLLILFFFPISDMPPVEYIKCAAHTEADSQRIFTQTFLTVYFEPSNKQTHTQ